MFPGYLPEKNIIRVLDPWQIGGIMEFPYENFDGIWSLNAGAGLQWNVTEHSALFVQPGFSYHFAGGNHIETYYTAHPASFNLAIGYRLTLF